MTISGKKATKTYAIQPATGGLVKIGKSVAPSVRVRDLQPGNHEPLTVVGEVDEDIESLLHRKFAAERAHLEWFVVSDRMYDHFKTAYGIELVRNDTSRAWLALYRLSECISTSQVEFMIHDTYELVERLWASGLVADLLSRKDAEARRAANENTATAAIKLMERMLRRAEAGNAYSICGFARRMRVDEMWYRRHAASQIRRTYASLPTHIRALVEPDYRRIVKEARKFRDEQPDHIDSRYGDNIKDLLQPRHEMPAWVRTLRYTYPDYDLFPCWLHTYIGGYFPVTDDMLRARSAWVRNKFRQHLKDVAA
jgi:hypothetical protein